VKLKGLFSKYRLEHRRIGDHCRRVLLTEDDERRGYAPGRLWRLHSHRAKKSQSMTTIIVFDEFFNYPGWEDHEYKTFVEFLRTNSEFNVKYLGLGGTTAASVLLERKPE
jgi:hypothetical protein